MKKIFFILLFCTIQFEIDAQTSVLFVEDTVSYKCKVISIKKLKKSIYGIRISLVIGQDSINHYIISAQSNSSVKTERIKVGNYYPLQLSRYHEQSYLQASSKFIQPILIGNNIISVTYDYSFPWVMLSPNLNGLNYVPSYKLSHINISKDSVNRFVYQFLNNISINQNKTTLFEMSDTTTLAKLFRQQYNKSIYNFNHINVSDFIFDSLFYQHSKPEYSDSISDFMSNIVLVKGEYFNIRVKWHVPGDPYPLSAMLVLRKENQRLIVTGISIIPLPYFENEFYK